MLRSVPFYSTVDASSVKNLTSKRIGFPYIIRKINISYDLGQEFLVQHKFFASLDDNTPSSGEPSGTNILETLGQVGYLVGDGEDEEIGVGYRVDFAGSYIKIHANNTDSFEHHVNAVIEIDDDIGQ